MGNNSRIKKERRLARQQVAAQSAEHPQAGFRGEEQERAISTSSPVYNRVWSAVHIVTILALCFALGIFPIEAEDIFSNILTGEYLWKTGAIPTEDPFSFTGPFKWDFNRPLPSLVFFGVHSLGGLPAVQVFCLGIIALAYVLLYLVWSHRLRMPHVVFASVAVTICASCFWFQTRIYVFAYLYTVIALLIITSSRQRAPLWLIPLQVLWINSHPSAILGIFLTAVWWAHEIWQARRFAIFSLWVLAGVVLANILSPIGFESFVRFAQELFASHPSRTQIYEWFSPFHPLVRNQHLAVWFYGSCGVLVLLLLSALPRRAQVRSVALLLPIVVVLFVLSLGSARHIPLFYFALLGLGVCTVAAAREAYAHSDVPAPRAPLQKPFVVTAFFWAVIAWVVAFGYSNGDAKRVFAFGIDARKFPSRAIDIVRGARIGGNIFTEYSMGAYFLYRAYPEYKVYIDSARLDEVYGEDWFMHYMRVGNDPALLKRDIERFDLRAFILPLPASRAEIVPIYTFLSSDPEWRLAFFDEGSMLYVQAREAAARGLRTYQRLNPFAAMGEVLRKEPHVFDQLVSDFALGDEVNPDSRPFQILKSWFEGVRRQRNFTGAVSTPTANTR